MKHVSSRRRFLKASATAVLGATVVPAGLAFGYAANERLGIGLVGVGGRGQWFVETMPRIGEDVVAMCDVNEHRAAASFAKLPDVPKYRDFRKMLDAEDRRLDAVMVATPDHNHAPISAAAMRRGKHVYCEKPLTNSVWEARTLRRLAAETGMATQMGNQGTATHAFREAVEIVQSGMLGEVREVHVWNCGGNGRRPVPSETEPVPDGLDWDLWLGPAPERPYHRSWMQWHSWRDFGTGKLGNWAVHSANLPCMGLRLPSLWNPDAPAATEATVRVEAKVPVLDRASFPNWEIIRFEFPARGAMPPVTIHWHNGIQAPGIREAIEPYLGRRLICGGEVQGAWLDDSGCVLVGSEGVLHATGHNSSYKLLPEKKWQGAKPPEPSLPRSGSHEREWLAACRGGPPAMSNFDYGSALTEFVLLGNVATQFDRPVAFDPAAMTCPGDEEATAALRRAYREGWSLST